ncbi:hypothetical protein NPX13_g7236 [Xylaria arbuscula]|uniref:Uncharacterized protein n=1 Tax=Xylaria arbuscula TaxID=114810 RepID=A0A9W8NAY1_9PEZI|nr:hypothetical protein NPX13_g7236 [Xylaria arbuscula]
MASAIATLPIARWVLPANPGYSWLCLVILGHSGFKDLRVVAGWPLVVGASGATTIALVLSAPPDAPSSERGQPNWLPDRRPDPFTSRLPG